MYRSRAFCRPNLWETRKVKFVSLLSSEDSIIWLKRSQNCVQHWVKYLWWLLSTEDSKYPTLFATLPVLFHVWSDNFRMSMKDYWITHHSKTWSLPYSQWHTVYKQSILTQKAIVLCSKCNIQSDFKKTGLYFADLLPQIPNDFLLYVYYIT